MNDGCYLAVLQVVMRFMQTIEFPSPSLSEVLECRVSTKGTPNSHAVCGGDPQVLAQHLGDPHH